MAQPQVTIARYTSLNALLLCLVMVAASCHTIKDLTTKAKDGEPKEKREKKEKKTKEPAADSRDVNVDFLLGMSFDEAAAISGSKGEVTGVARVAGDEVKVLRTGPNGEVRKLRVSGHVFLEMAGPGERSAALSQEAYVTEDEIILRGRPVLQRGKGMLEGTADSTVFYIFGNQVRVIGRHKVRNETLAEAAGPRPDAVITKLRKSSPSKPPSLPEAGPWRDGPNPLLPPLDLSAVPESMREELRRQAEAEDVLQQSLNQGQQLPIEPLPVDPVTPQGQ